MIDWNLLAQYADVIGIISAVIGVITTIFAAYAGYQAKKIREETQKKEEQEKERANQKIKFVLKIKETNKIIKPLIPSIRRAELNRAEVMGILGMIPMIKEKERERFKLNYVNKQEFIDELNRISNSDKPETFIIYCREEELTQFDI